MARFSVLIVDDDAQLAEGLAWRLRDREYQVWSAMSGAEALALVRQGLVRPSVIVLRFELPVMDGRAFLAHQPNEPSIALTPVIVLADDPDDARRAVPGVRAVVPRSGLEEVYPLIAALRGGDD